MSDFNINNNSNVLCNYSVSSDPSLPPQLSIDMKEIETAYTNFNHDSSAKNFSDLQKAINQLKSHASQVNSTKANALVNTINGMQGDGGILQRISQELEMHPDRELSGDLSHELNMSIQNLSSQIGSSKS